MNVSVYHGSVKEFSLFRPWMLSGDDPHTPYGKAGHMSCKAHMFIWGL